MDESLSELQTPQTKSIVLGNLVLFDISAGFKCSKQSKNIVLVELKPFAKFGHANLINAPVELLQYIKSMRDRLNRIIGFLAPDHVSSWMNTGVGTYSTKVRSKKAF